MASKRELEACTCMVYAGEIHDTGCPVHDRMSTLPDRFMQAVADALRHDYDVINARAERSSKQKRRGGD